MNQHESGNSNANRTRPCRPQHHDRTSHRDDDLHAAKHDPRAGALTPSSAPTAAAEVKAEPVDTQPLPFLCLRVEERLDLDANLPDRPRDTAQQALLALDTMSRRIEDLARELKCLGYFDESDPDRPKAA